MEILLRDENDLFVKRKEEIKRMVIVLREKYEIYDNRFGIQLSEKLYDSGIGLNMLLDRRYYDKIFDMDEIVRYFIRKLKITYVDFEVNRKRDECVINNSVQIIPFNKVEKKVRVLQM